MVEGRGVLGQLYLGLFACRLEIRRFIMCSFEEVPEDLLHLETVVFGLGFKILECLFNKLCSD